MRISVVAATHRAAIETAFQSGIDAASAATYTLFPKATEPQLVWGLFSAGVASWSTDLKAIFTPHGITVRVGGVFCHSTPMVKFRGMKGKAVEMGDLLVIIRAKDGKQEWRSALLFQSKKQSIGSRLPPGDQLHLLQQWPRFEYVNGTLAGEWRKVYPGPHRGAQYHIIDTQKGVLIPCPDNWSRQLSPGFPVQALSSSLASMISGSEGRNFHSRTGRGTFRGWSRVVWDLLRETGRLDASKYPGGGNRRQLSFFVGGFSNEFLVEIDPAWAGVKLESEEPPPKEPDARAVEGNFGGIPTIIIDLEFPENAQ